MEGIITQQEREYLLLAAQKGPWAIIPFLVPSSLEKHDEEGNEGFLSFGGQEADYNGCWLGYGIPVADSIETKGGLNWNHSYGGLGGQSFVIIPPETEWMTVLRCSDTGIHSGYTVCKIVDMKVYPVLASVFSAPHASIGRGVEITGTTLLRSFYGHASNAEIAGRLNSCEGGEIPFRNWREKIDPPATQEIETLDRALLLGERFSEIVKW